MTTALLLAASLLNADLSYHANFVDNPSFEKDDNRDRLPDGWKGFPYDSRGRAEWDREMGRTGKASLRLRDPGKAKSKDWKRSTVRWSSAQFPIVPGTKYTISVWIKTRNVTGRVRAKLSWQRKGRWLNEASTPVVMGTSDWKKLSVTATAPPAADTVKVFFELGSGMGTAWFDDVTLAGRSTLRPKVTYVFNNTKDWFPFTFPLNDTNRDSIDLSGLLEAPAGRHGFVTAGEDGHFYFEDGRRSRFFGTNLGGRDVAPTKAQSRMLAARFAKYGVNMVRLHSMDSRYSLLIDYAKGGSRNLNPVGLDRIDFLISELKKRGIYVYLDLLDYRMFTEADGVRHADAFTANWQGSMKGASIFDERMIELQKEFATKLLTHRNPYTGLRYVDDPAIAVVETTNENGVFYFLLMKDLSLPEYRRDLLRRWNRWLMAQYKNRTQLARSWSTANGTGELLSAEDPVRGTVGFPFGQLQRFSKGALRNRNAALMGPLRTHDLLRFLGELQHHYYQQMRTHLKQIGVRVPITGTNQTFMICDISINAAMSDFISRNQYWHHPSVKAKPFFKFANVPMLRSDLSRERNPLAVFAGSSVVGKPFILAEFNFPWPNEYRCEGLLMATAYACLQDWDAVLLFSYTLNDPKLSFFRSQSDPARWGEFPAAALMFHRHDVATARNEVHVVHTKKDVFTMQPDQRYAPYSNFRYLAFLSKVRHAFPKGTTYEGKADVVLASGLSADAQVSPRTHVVRLAEMPWKQWLYPQFVRQAKDLKLSGYEQMNGRTKQFDSDTGELSLNYQNGLLTINTPRTKGAIGFLKQAGLLDLGGMTIDSRTSFAAVTATSLDGQPIGRSRRILVTAVARVENSTQGFWPAPPNPKSWSPFTTWSLPGEGRPPVIAEPVHAILTLKLPAAAVVYALDATGRRRKTPITATYRGGQLRFDPSAARSIWCEVVTTEGEK